MEETLDDVEAGKTPWKSVLRQFYGAFSEEIRGAETGKKVMYYPSLVVRGTTRRK